MEAKTPKGHCFPMQSQSMTHPNAHAMYMIYLISIYLRVSIQAKKSGVLFLNFF